jgi:hypothetical protein
MCLMLVVTNGKMLLYIYIYIYMLLCVSLSQYPNHTGLAAGTVVLALPQSACWQTTFQLFFFFFFSFVQFLIIFTFWGFSRILGVMLVATQ